VAGVVVGTSYADLCTSTWGGLAPESSMQHTVEVMSEEHTSQTYLMPPSVPRVPVFFLMTPMVCVCVCVCVGVGVYASMRLRAAHVEAGPGGRSSEVTSAQQQRWLCRAGQRSAAQDC